MGNLRKHFPIAPAIASVVIIIIVISLLQNRDQKVLDKTDAGDLSLMLPLLNVQNPESDLRIIERYIKPGDIIVFPPDVYMPVSKLKARSDGVEIGTGGTSVNALLEGIPGISSDIDYVTYDYEPDFTPEFKPGQKPSEEFFGALMDQSHKHGKKLIVAPVYYYGRLWNWTEVAMKTDVVVVQVQNYQTGARVGEEFSAAYLGMNITEVAKRLVSEIKEKTPAKLYLQLDVLVTDDPADVLYDINSLKDIGIDGIAIWYNPGISGSSSKISRLEQVLKNLDR